jgi:hypothetical protein
MTDTTQPTLKQWKRRAVKAEQLVEFLQKARETDAQMEMDQWRELSTLRVALREAHEAITWALEKKT